MTDHSENTWFRRNMMAVLIAVLITLIGYINHLQTSTIQEKIDVNTGQFSKVLDDHEGRIRSLERKP